MNTRRVVLAHRRLTAYRVPFFDALRERLRERGIELTLLVGEGKAEELVRHDEGELPWAQRVPTRYWLGGRLCWQPLHRYVNGADLVVLTQESSQIAVQLLALRPSKTPVAFWGHGATLQRPGRSGLRERYKAWVSRRVHWWFAYTDLSAEHVERAGFPRSRITVVNNAVETLPGIGEGSRGGDAPPGPTGIFIGSFYELKRLDVLFGALDAIRGRVPGFRFVIVGDGPERGTVEAFVAQRPWCSWVGARFGAEKQRLLAEARVLIHPGAVGLGLLDSFIMGVPLVTTDWGIHGPEIAYLRDGVNGRMTPDSDRDFVDACVQVLTDDDAWTRLRRGGLVSSQEYTLASMVERFVEGIERALDDVQAQRAIRPGRVG